MSSVEDSDKPDDSLSQELEGVLRMTRLHRHKHHHRAGRTHQRGDALCREAIKEFMFGKFEQATESCKKIIAIHPQNPQPYYIIGTMHEEAGKKNNDYSELCKAAEYFFFYAYYSHPDIEKWLKVGDMSFELKIYPQAAYCYGRALKINGSNLDTNLKRCQCLELCRETKKAINIYKKIIDKISTSVEVYKRYAKLQFRRGQFAKSREILLSYEHYKEDINIKFMICETYLKEKQYEKLFIFLKEIVLMGQDPNIYDLQIQIVQMLFICSMMCEETKLDSEGLKEHLFYEYEENQLDQLYEEIILHIQNQNEQMTFEFVNFLLKYKAHKKIQNYLYASEYLKKNNRIKQALKILKDGVKVHPHSTELSTQLNHIKMFMRAKTEVKTQKIEQQDIFYSDEDEQNNKEFLKGESSSQAPRMQKTKGIKKLKTEDRRRQVKNPQISKKLLLNTSETLDSVFEKVKKIADRNQKINQLEKYSEQLKNSLQFLTELDNQKHQDTQNEQQRGILSANNSKKRRNLHHSRRFNFIYQNSQTIIRSLKSIIYFMKEMMMAQHYETVLQFSQILSKANFFKCKNKIPEFHELKTYIFEIGILACLCVGKFNKCLFFLRYLVHRYPENSLYLVLIRNITMLKSQKMGLSSIIKKDFENFNQMEGDQSKIIYLMGLQYMDNCFFELAITMFLNVLQKGTLKQQILRDVNLCLTTCFLQIGSSRTVFNKLDCVNRSAFCFKKYLQIKEECLQMYYNMGRWFSQVKMYGRAIEYLRKVLECEEVGQLQKKAAYCLMIIQKQMQNFEEVNSLSQRYFSLQP